MGGVTHQLSMGRKVPPPHRDRTQQYAIDRGSLHMKQAQIPTNFVAGLAKASPAELWAIEDAAERAVPKVDLSLDRPTG